MPTFAVVMPDWELVQRTVAQLNAARALPQELEGSVPTIEQIEAELSDDL